MKKSILSIIILLPFCFFAQNNIVQTDAGKIEGTIDAHDTHVFKGIPFAAPPVGDLRWKAPQAVIPWKGIKKCETFGPSPVQAKPMPFMFWSKEYLIPETPIDEDCLYLNVWTKSLKKKKPVLVYIYGGGFRSGGSGCPIYDGTAMAQKDVVFVSINYRVGVFGFLAHPDLTAESKNNSAGNYALLDMVEALKWVKNNISAFGGDPNNVTIAGQSAGAFAVNYLTVSPLAKGLFHKAIAQSGGSFYSAPGATQTLKEAEVQGLAYANSLKCTTIAELRAKSATEILQQSGGSQWPIVDGYIIPKSIYDSYKSGKQNDVPMLMGWNKEDVVGMGNKNAEAYKNMLSEQFSTLSNRFLKEYPAGSNEEAQQSQKQMGRDQTFGIQVYTWAKMQFKMGKQKVYLYNFNRNLPAYDEATNFGAFHSSEIVYAYNNLHTSDRPWETVDHKIADSMSSYWANFAHYGNPNHKDLPNWPAYNTTSQEAMIIDTSIKSEKLPDLNKMLVWEQYFNSEKH